VPTVSGLAPQIGLGATVDALAVRDIVEVHSVPYFFTIVLQSVHRNWFVV